MRFVYNSESERGHGDAAAAPAPPAHLVLVLSVVVLWTRTGRSRRSGRCVGRPWPVPVSHHAVECGMTHTHTTSRLPCT